MGLTRAHMRIAAISFQGLVVLGCAAAGWRLAHPATSAAVQSRQAAGPIPALAQPVMLPALPAPRASGQAAWPGLSGLVDRVNRDDAALYREQWRTLQLVASATRSYVEHHILPLILAAATGAAR